MRPSDASAILIVEGDPIFKVSGLFFVIYFAAIQVGAMNAPSGSEMAWALNNKTNQPQVRETAGRLTFDWRDLLGHLRTISPRLASDVTVTLLVNGEEVATQPAQAGEIQISDCVRGQCDYYLLFFDGKGTLHHRTEPVIRERQSVQNIPSSAFDSFARNHSLRFELPPSMTGKGVTGKLTEKAVELGYKKIVWVLAPSAPVKTRHLIRDTADPQVLPVLNERGEFTSAKIQDLKTGKIVAEGLPADHFFFKVDASFNGNCFFWDDMFVALATVPYYPAVARSTVDFWLAIQKVNGGVIPREVRKANLKSLWFIDVVRADQVTVPNLQFTNPYLLHRVALELYRFDPNAENLILLRRVAQSIVDYTTWIHDFRSVKDQKNQLIGYVTSALGSGGDDSRGGRGNDQTPASLQSGWVDLLAQQLDLHRSLLLIDGILRDKGSPFLSPEKTLTEQKMVQQLSDLLNTKYWDSKKNFFYDLVKDGKAFKRDTQFESIFSFWPLLSGAVDRRKANLIAQKFLTPNKFGGSFPLPANARDMILSLDANEDGYWSKWSHWPSTGAMAVTGFAESGRPDIAYDLAFNFVRAMEQASQTTVYEFYGEVADSLKGRPGQHKNHKTRADFAGWGKVPPIFNMLRHVVGLEPQFDGYMKWNLLADLRIGEALAVQHIVYRGSKINDLRIRRVAESRYEVWIQSEKPVDLEITVHNRSNRIQLGGDPKSYRSTVVDHSPRPSTAQNTTIINRETTR